MHVYFVEVNSLYLHLRIAWTKCKRSMKRTVTDRLWEESIMPLNCWKFWRSQQRRSRGIINPFQRWNSLGCDPSTKLQALWSEYVFPWLLSLSAGSGARLVQKKKRKNLGELCMNLILRRPLQLRTPVPTSRPPPLSCIYVVIVCISLFHI